MEDILHHPRFGAPTLPTSSEFDHLDRDWQIRLAAMNALRELTLPSGGVVTREELQAGFKLPRGTHTIPFASRGAGIWRPQAMPHPPGAALSLTTSLADPYADSVSDDGWLEYHYQSGPIDNHFNLALRNSAEARRPLIYFRALASGVFEAAFPVFVLADLPEQRMVRLAFDTPGLGERDLFAGGSPEILKQYATATTLVRLHQGKFRFAVMAAYQRKCAVCTLGTNDRLSRLLDAAHIIEDRSVSGLPEIPNGLALCKIHHSAYDLNILGISPDNRPRIHIREDILAQVDGLMLQHGIKAMDGRRLILPRRHEHHPNPDFLAERFEKFRAA